MYERAWEFLMGSNQMRLDYNYMYSQIVIPTCSSTSPTMLGLHIDE